ncbi:glycosyltransferase family 2 protein [Coprothermobacter proteolyticus]|uniref:glycosyltransferase family 2 protein n=1 Tax=Coprothermobacter proteolyticus TaxID=35786 RepID=UPI00131B0F5A|nr:glycosyltransferase family 2 protein [Coprothermobacter proteolyticus]
MKPLVTVGIPFKNPGKDLLLAVKSVFAQTFENWELILINDGSDDGSEQLIKKIQDPRVRVIEDGKNLGLPARLNQIIAESAGELLARMDADDAMHPRRLEKQVEIFQHNPSIDVVDTCAYIINKEDKVVGKERCGHTDPNNLYRALKWGIVLHASVMAKKDWYVKNPYRLDYPRAEDRELFVRTVQDTKFYHIVEPLYFHRFEGNVRLNSYLQSYSSERKVLMEYGPKLIGRTRTALLYSRSLAKSSILYMLSILGFENIINKNKYEPLSEAERHHAQSLLDEIHNLELP